MNLITHFISLPILTLCHIDLYFVPLLSTDSLVDRVWPNSGLHFQFLNISMDKLNCSKKKHLTLNRNELSHKYVPKHVYTVYICYLRE